MTPLKFLITPLVEAGEWRRCIWASIVRIAMRSLSILAEWVHFRRFDEPGNYSAMSHAFCLGFRPNPCLLVPTAGRCVFGSGDSLPPSEGGGQDQRGRVEV